MNSIEFLRAGRPTFAQMSYALTQDRVISPDTISSLERYYLLYWTGEELKSRVREGCIKIFQEETYKIIWRDFTPEVFYAQPFVRLSFRAPAKDYGLPAYVMITAVSQDKCAELMNHKLRKKVTEQTRGEVK